MERRWRSRTRLGENRADALILSEIDSLRRQVEIVEKLFIAQFYIMLQCALDEAEFRSLCTSVLTCEGELSSTALNGPTIELWAKLVNSGRLDELMEAYSQLRPVNRF